ncbi:hypothetical protein LINPERPRIM_LOCUS12226 [Linum perenne]
MNINQSYWGFVASQKFRSKTHSLKKIRRHTITVPYIMYFDRGGRLHIHERGRRLNTHDYKVCAHKVFKPLVR